MRYPEYRPEYLEVGIGKSVMSVCASDSGGSTQAKLASNTNDMFLYSQGYELQIKHLLLILLEVYLISIWLE